MASALLTPELCSIETEDYHDSHKLEPGKHVAFFWIENIDDVIWYLSIVDFKETRLKSSISSVQTNKARNGASLGILKREQLRWTRTFCRKASSAVFIMVLLKVICDMLMLFTVP